MYGYVSRNGGGPRRHALEKASARIHRKKQVFLHVLKHRGGSRRPALGRASARIHRKNNMFLNDLGVRRPEGTRDFIVLNKGHQRPPRTFGQRGGHVADEASRILVLDLPQDTWLNALSHLVFRFVEPSCKAKQNSLRKYCVKQKHAGGA